MEGRMKPNLSIAIAVGLLWEYCFDSSTGLLRRTTRPSFRILDDQISRGPDTHAYYYEYRSGGSVLYPHYWIESTEDSTHLFVVGDIATLTTQ